jgi:DNA-binding PadR family transcriptional regulator
MFHRRFSKRLRDAWAEGRHEPGPGHEWEPEHGPHGPHHHHQHVWGFRRGGAPFGWEEDATFRFGPRGGPPFDRPFWRGGPFGGDPFDEDSGGRRRQRRGDIKFALLELLAEQPRHGYELIKELEQRYGGFYRPSPGSVYPTLQLLEDEGHLTSESVDGKRVYTITDSGRQLLAEQRSQRDEAGADPRVRALRGRGGPELRELRENGMALVASVMQVAKHGSPEQIQSVMKLLADTRREIYAILSQPDQESQE